MGTGLAFQFFRQAAWHHGQAIGQPTCRMHLLGKDGWPSICLLGKRNYPDTFFFFNSGSSIGLSEGVQ